VSQALRTLYCSTPATSACLSLAEAKSHLRVTHIDDDDDITDLALAAQQHVEDYLSRTLMPATWVLSLSAFPAGKRPLMLDVAPYASLTSLAYTDGAGDGQTLTETTDFKVSGNARPAFLFPVYGTTWPTARREPDSVVVTWVAGYADAASVPEVYKRAMRLLIGHWYENREQVVVGTIASELPVGVRTLLRPHRDVRV